MEKKIITLALISVVAILGIFAYHNFKFDSKRNMMEIIAFIEENTDLVYKGDTLPVVKIKTQKEMCEILFDVVPEPCHIAGYYNDETNEIVIGDKPTIHMVKEKFREVILAHELVHFLQKTNGVYETIECRRALEQDAFKMGCMVHVMSWMHVSLEKAEGNLLYVCTVQTLQCECGMTSAPTAPTRRTTGATGSPPEPIGARQSAAGPTGPMWIRRTSWTHQTHQT